MRKDSIKIRDKSYLKVGALVHGALVADLAGVEEDAVGAALLPPRHYHVLLHLQGGSCNSCCLAIVLRNADHVVFTYLNFN